MSAAVDDARAAIADLCAVLGRVDDDGVALHDAITRFDHTTVLDVALRLERSLEAVAPAERAVVGAVERARDEGVGAAIADELNAARAQAARVMQAQRHTAALLTKARSFNRAYQQALLPPTQSYGRRARFTEGAVASSMRTAG